MKFTINDKMHVVVRIKMRKEAVEEFDINGNLVADPFESMMQKGGGQQEFHSVYYFENCLFNLLSQDYPNY